MLLVHLRHMLLDQGELVLYLPELSYKRHAHLLAHSVIQLIWCHAMRNEVPEDLVEGLCGNTFNPARPHTTPCHCL